MNICKHCGEPTSPLGPKEEEIMENDHFEKIWQQEMIVRRENASLAFAGAGQPAFVYERNARNKRVATAKLYDMIDNLSSDDARAYGEYRRSALAEIGL